MKKLLPALLLLAACAPESTSSLYWSDGDSGRLNGQDFRLHGVDAPETGGVGAYGGAECEHERELGYEAKEEVVEFTRGKFAYFGKEYGEDRYGRLVVDLFVDGRNVGDEMVGRGVLRRWDYDGGDPKPAWCSGR
ncbi:thermonuclease family protein [Henriciella mobilis]|uniref:thermonuclease family protein n=1 Tax=Henriciella mobilis TaxID=2305467 RepID=UPI000E667EEA|nr:thermonuclease family protein [Henriciella mobilis]RIJ15927.1 thermonuclease family protein [Henriciella mobilis]RIJ21137.1 thermonuclease family protein [Henriciella mobilis]RIJ23162.1 thermonuclease family protein [Henriciella mobilis]